MTRVDFFATVEANDVTKELDVRVERERWHWQTKDTGATRLNVDED